ncbi:MAG: replication-relaxation family protein [Mycobacterium kyogaense]|uniref:replication-relaxation family protein n=1 Tax=Mycobacterium kyogaense TaxID=2212479 RepID=UPI002FFADDB3
MMRLLSQLADALSDRDLRILHDLEEFRLLTTRQIQRLHFADGHATISAATRACTRVMGRLKGHGLVDTLSRRIGGVRQGSAGLTWQLAATGERYLRAARGDPKRRRYSEPGTAFTQHTVLVSELAVLLRELGRTQPDWSITHLAAEQRAWRAFSGPHGRSEWLRPDLHLIAADDDFEEHWFIEADRGREHGPQLLRKCQTYIRYMRSGRYQAEHELFPTVLWVVPDFKRIRELDSIVASANLPRQVFRFRTLDGFIDTMTTPEGPEEVPLPGILTEIEPTT